METDSWVFFSFDTYFILEDFHKFQGICVREEASGLVMNASRAAASFCLLIYVSQPGKLFTQLFTISTSQKLIQHTIIFVKCSMPLTYTEFKSHMSWSLCRNEAPSSVHSPARWGSLDEGHVRPKGTAPPEPLLPKSCATEQGGCHRCQQGLNRSVSNIQCINDSEF